MEVTLCLEDHCVETAAKHRYDELTKELLRDDDREKEEELSFLIEFLENANFSELRKAGFDGSEEIVVRVSKKNEDFSVEKIKT